MDYLIVLMMCMQGCYGLKMVDLTYELDTNAITWPFNPRFNMSIMFRGMWNHLVWLENNRLDLAEHTGTHIDSPNHVAHGKGPWNNHQIPIERLGGPGVIIDVKSKAEADSDYRVTVDDVKAWETRNGRIPYGAVVLMNSGWQKYYPDYNAVFKTNNISDSGSYHFPSWHEDAVDWLISHRIVYCVGGDTPSTDYGQSETFPVHLLLSKENIIGIENAAYLDKLPESGSTIFVPVVKIRDGSGGPARMFATLPEDEEVESNVADSILMSPMIQLLSFMLIGAINTR
ncbi:isatin hydrolase-like [Ylistrum balloti]|uniref:isatin hydrolase-like n=1 Tax=Ylistrum balloti TaxID=509963 RepID=UPI002905DB63|nr:isatin hydrolase-like [Ylistrum balloti]